MNNLLSNILLTKEKSRVNDFLNYNFKIHKESHYDPLIEKFNEKERFQAAFYDNFCLDIVTESVFNYPHPYLSEKVFRSIAEKKIFIYVGPCYSLKFLKSLGFKTFFSYINEDYDNELDASKRMTMIEKEIEIFVNKTKSEVKEILSKSVTILEHNFINLSKLYDVELDKVKNQLKV